MSTIFDSIGIDPGIVIIILLIVVLVLIASTVSSNMRLTRLERKYTTGTPTTMHLTMLEEN